MESKKIANILKEVRKSSTFLNINNYKSNNGEVSSYTLIFNSSYRNAVQKSILMLESLTFKTKIDNVAKIELLESLNKSLKLLGDNDEVLNKDKYNYFYSGDNLIRGLKQDKETGKLYISGMVSNKHIIVEGNEDTKEKSKLAKAKENIKNRLPISKYRTFIFHERKAKSLSIDGLTILAPKK